MPTPPPPSLPQRLDAAIGMACCAVLYATLSLVFSILTINVGLRYIAGTSLSWASELPELLFPWMIMAGVVLAAQHGSHIAVVILTQRMRPAVRRWVLSAGSVATAAMYAGLAWIAWPLAEIAADERTPILGVPGSVSVLCLMTGFVLLGVVTLLRLPRAWNDTTVHSPASGQGDPTEQPTPAGAAGACP